MFNLDKVRTEIKCPQCYFLNRILLKQIRLHNVIICRGCKKTFASSHNKTIFLCIIDIFEYEETASKRGKLKTCTISEDDIITEINAQEKAD